MLTVNHHVVISEEDLNETFIRSSGPGGQHVNKTSTAVQLRYDTNRADYLSEAAKNRLRRLAGSRMNADGVLLIEASRYRYRERNRQEARQRLSALLRRALEKPKPRQRTRPTMASIRNRLEEKSAAQCSSAGGASRRGKIDAVGFILPSSFFSSQNFLISGSDPIILAKMPTISQQKNRFYFFLIAVESMQWIQPR